MPRPLVYLDFEAVHYMRRLRKMTNSDLAHTLGYRNVSRVSKAVNGALIGKRVEVKTAMEYAKALGCDLSVIVRAGPRRELFKLR